MHVLKLRAETDSSALKKKCSDDSVYKKNLPSNTSSRLLYNIAEKIRYETLGGQMLKGIEKNFQQNYSHIINNKKKDQLKTKEDVHVSEAFELYMLKKFHQIELNPLTHKKLNNIITYLKIDAYILIFLSINTYLFGLLRFILYYFL